MTKLEIEIRRLSDFLLHNVPAPCSHTRNYCNCAFDAEILTQRNHLMTMKWALGFLEADEIENAKEMLRNFRSLENDR